MRRLVLTTWLLLLTAGLVFSQDMERRTIKRDMDISWQGGRLRLSVDFTDVFTPRLRRRLSSGVTSRLLVDVVLRERHHHTPLARALLQCTVLYDLWEERYFVRRELPGRRHDLGLRSLADVVKTCGRIEHLELAPLLALPARVEVEAELRVTVNPTSPRLQRKVRQYLANPGGSSPLGSPRSFFGSFSRIFVDEKEIQADMIYTYRSPARKLVRPQQE